MTDKPFIVTRMQATDFFSFESLEKLILNGKKVETRDGAAKEGTDKSRGAEEGFNNINWLHVREI